MICESVQRFAQQRPLPNKPSKGRLRIGRSKYIIEDLMYCAPTPWVNLLRANDADRQKLGRFMCTRIKPSDRDDQTRY